jgi:hypothetical protein
MHFDKLTQLIPAEAAVPGIQQHPAKFVACLVDNRADLV